MADKPRPDQHTHSNQPMQPQNTYANPQAHVTNANSDPTRTHLQHPPQRVPTSAAAGIRVPHHVQHPQHPYHQQHLQHPQLPQLPQHSHHPQHPRHPQHLQQLQQSHHSQRHPAHLHHPHHAQQVPSASHQVSKVHPAHAQTTTVPAQYGMYPGPPRAYPGAPGSAVPPNTPPQPGVVPGAVYGPGPTPPVGYTPVATPGMPSPYYFPSSAPMPRGGAGPGAHGGPQPPPRNYNHAQGQPHMHPAVTAQQVVQQQQQSPQQAQHSMPGVPQNPHPHMAGMHMQAAAPPHHPMHSAAPGVPAPASANPGMTPRNTQPFVPTQQKKVLKIVNPNTNEEVIPPTKNSTPAQSEAQDRSTPSVGSPVTPLDPSKAKASGVQSASGQTANTDGDSSTGTAQPAPSEQMPRPSSAIPIVAPTAQQSAGSAASSAKTLSGNATTAAPPSAAGVAKPAAPSIPETSSVSSAEAGAQVNGSASTEHAAETAAPAAGVGRVNGDAPKGSKADVAVTSTAGSAGSTTTKSGNAGAGPNGGGTSENPASDGNDEEDESRSPPRRARPASLRFADGERRQYPMDFILEMRPHSDEALQAKLNTVLVGLKLSKWGIPDAPDGRDESRGGRHGPGPNRGAMMQPDRGDLRRGGAFPIMPMGAPVLGGRAPPGAPGAGGQYGGYDAFDLSSARGRKPPPTAGGPGGRSGDPRGTGQFPNQGGRGGRFDGPTRQGMGPMDFAAPMQPVEKLVKSENAWARKKENDDEVTAKVKQVRSHLNKLTLEKFDRIFSQIVELDISNLDVLRGIVTEIFEKTVTEPMFAGMYAELCRRLNAHYDSSGKAYADENGRKLTFRSVLLKNCQNEFVRFESQSKEDKEAAEQEALKEAAKEQGAADDEKIDPKEAKRLKDIAAQKTLMAKKRMLGNVRFIGELYKKDLLPETIIHSRCIVPLLRRAIDEKEEDVIEALCNLISRTGKKLSEAQGGKSVMDQYFDRLNNMSKDHTLPARTRFMLQDLADQRKNGWNLRRDDQKAKTISEIKEDIKREERAKEMAQANARRGGGGGRRDGFASSRAPPAQTPRMTMMPSVSRQGSGSGASRTQNMFEKYASSTSSSGGHGQQGGAAAGMRLGPARGGGPWNPTRGASGSGSSLGGASLRPGGGGLRPGGGGGGGSSSSSTNAFAALSSADSDSGAEARPTARPGSTRFATGRTQGSSGATNASGMTKAPAEMDPEKLKRKAKSIVQEFFEINDLNELRECVTEEVKEVNYTKFITEALKVCLEAKAANKKGATRMFVHLLKDTVSAEKMIAGFTPLVRRLVDLEMDDPKAGETFAMYLGAMAASGKLADKDDVAFGLGFLKTACADIEDKKKTLKIVLLSFSELYAGLQESVPDEAERGLKVRAAYEYVGMDLKALAEQWNFMRGLSVLEDMLKDAGAEFLEPLVGVQIKLKAMLEQDTAGDEVAKYVTETVPKELMFKDVLARTLVNVVLSWALAVPVTEKQITTRFNGAGGKVLKAGLIENGKENPTDGVQMSVLLETQLWLHNAASDLSEAKDVKCAATVFHMLYDEDIVEEETFLKWKDDTKLSGQVAGKSEALLQTSSFFNWLATAEQE